MRVTREWLMQHRSERGGWNFSQLALLGETWPPAKGWIERAIDREIADDRAALFVEYSKRRPNKAERQDVKRMVGLLPAKAVDEPIKWDHNPEIRALLEHVRRNRTLRGSPCPKYDGDVKGEKFLLSYQWRRLRMAALLKHGARCQCCGSTASDGVRMHVDHIQPRSKRPDLALDIDNLQVLCEVCNHGKGNWDATDWRGHATANQA